MVYVDPPLTPWRNSLYAHMYADTEEELHEMAQRIGLQRNWFQNHPALPHYDVSERMRGLAIKAGAVPRTRKETGAFIIERRKKGKANV